MQKIEAISVITESWCIGAMSVSNDHKNWRVVYRRPDGFLDDTDDVAVLLDVVKEWNAFRRQRLAEASSKEGA